MSNISPPFSINYQRTGSSKKYNELGMRQMQERAFNRRGEKYLLIKSPPASGKSRALMFIAIDKIKNQNLKKAIVIVPEKSIGKSFDSVELSKNGFWSDWVIQPKWNLCNAPGLEGSKVKSLKSFLDSDDINLVCTHATFRFFVEENGIECLDNCLIAIDEFHHVSANSENVLGKFVKELILRDKVHIVAMTGSYFRGDSVPVLSPNDEKKFETVTYTYFEQLNGYEYLKELKISYFFYSKSYLDDILKVLDSQEKTILHIPNVNSRESTKDKIQEVEFIIDKLGEWQGTDPETGFQKVKLTNGNEIKIADLVNDDETKRTKVLNSLRSEEMETNRNYVDIIIALGMAKEGFDWIWCEHALTVGYRASLTEVVQIIGRATRDAPDKTITKFTNLIVEPDSTEERVTEAVNDTLKAIAASLLMEQVLVPNFNFKTKEGPDEGFDYGEEGYKKGENNVGYDKDRGEVNIEIKGLKEISEEAEKICKEDLKEIIAKILQDRETVERGIFDNELIPEEITQLRVGKIISENYPEFSDDDQEGMRQRVVAAMNLIQESTSGEQKINSDDKNNLTDHNTQFIEGVRKYLNVNDINVDFIDSINPFSKAYSIVSKSMNAENLEYFSKIIASKKIKLSFDEARELAYRALQFKRERGVVPSINSDDPWEKRMAEGMLAFGRMKSEET